MTDRTHTLFLLPVVFPVLLCLHHFSYPTEARRCSYNKRIHASPTYNANEALSPNGLEEGFSRKNLQQQPPDEHEGSPGMPPTINAVPIIPTTLSTRVAQQDVYLWPSLADDEKSVIRSAFHQIHRRTCIRFNELPYKPWYHADRWRPEKPYVVIRKSKSFSGYSDNLIEGIARRSLLYITESALHNKVLNNSRGMVMDQLLRFMGFREEYLRPDAPSYIQPSSEHVLADPKALANRPQPPYSNEQLQWPFDPESITVPSRAREEYQLTRYCQAREQKDIGAGQRVGLLTRWDAVKLNSMYCPAEVGVADPRMGPCVVARRARVVKAKQFNANA